MTDILADYREWAAAQPTRVSTHSDRCHMYHTECMVHRLARRLEAATLTDAERSAVVAAIGWIESPSLDDEAMPEDYLPITSTLRGLLERTAP